ncbi:MAG: enoyl-CoA hydratase/isomerase family protein [Planctomycetes bacterium]|nr:enoyl-CoA hydratase/isomerase family protein [Planctomycetota bacterium]
MPEFKHLRLEVEDGLATLAVDRPEVLNALSFETVGELDRAFAWLAEEVCVRAVVLTGAGDRAFVAGADIRELAKLDADGARESSRRGQATLARIEGFAKPVVAAIHGFALGGGCEIALACHVRVIAATAKIGLPEVTLGLIPGYGGTQRLPRLVGRGKAMELVLTGEPVDGREAFRIGLADVLVDPQPLPASKSEAAALVRKATMDRARGLARTIMKRGPVAIRHAIEAVRRGSDASLEEGQSLEAALFGLCLATHDAKEGTAAFLEKREPRYQGR